MTCESCKRDDAVKESSGPGRFVGALAHSFLGIFAPLPDDFTYLYCSRCNRRLLTPEVEARFHAIEDAYVARPK